jgi:uncharacterized protein (DUF983 family)
MPIIEPAHLSPAPQDAPANSTGGTGLLQALLRGFSRRCPGCGAGHLFRGYVKQEPVCTGCGADLLQFRADDAPAYFTILLVGHVIVPAMLWLEVSQHPSTLLHLLLWVPLTLAMTLFLLPPVKGALIGVQWAFGVKS